MFVAKSTLSHVSKFNGSLRAGIHEPVTASRMELCRSDHFCQLLHICRLYINNVEALVLDVEVPHVDAEVIAADKSLSIAINRYAVNMICVGIGIYTARYGGHNGVMVGHSRKL